MDQETSSSVDQSDPKVDSVIPETRKAQDQPEQDEHVSKKVTKPQDVTSTSTSTLDPTTPSTDASKTPNKTTKSGMDLPASIERSKAKASPSQPQTPLGSSSRLLKPFKTPALKDGSTSSGGGNSSSNQPAEIRNLEQRIRVLKQAIKYEEDGRLDSLSESSTRWRDVAREAAEELWEKHGGSNEPIVDASFDSSFGYDDKPTSLQTPDTSIESTNALGGWKDATEVRENVDLTEAQEDAARDDEAASEVEEKEKQVWDIGEMLSRFGVDKEVLGWSSSEGNWLE